jgi:hypothetical protein
MIFQLVHRHFVCYSTDSEDSEGGNFYVNGYLVVPLPAGELDPGML